MSQRFFNPAPQFFYSGTPAAPLSGGLMYFYEPGTTTPKDTYSDNALTTPNTNPVVLSSSGVLPNVFLDGAYKVILQDKDGVQQPGWPRDSVNSIVPLAFAAWDSTATYGAGGINIVYASNAQYYVSIQASNMAHEPSVSPLWWKPAFDYFAIGQLLVAAGYVAIGNASTGLAGVNINTKGSILAGNGTIPAALAPGTDTHVLTLDSGQPLGVKWATVPSAPLVLLATLTPTAAANLDSLNVFSSTYDNYLIVMNDIRPAADDSLYIRFAVAGSVVATNSYGTVAGTNAVNDAGTSAFTTQYAQVSGSVEATSGYGLNATITVKNANGASGSLKSFQGSAEYQSSDTGYLKGIYSIGGFAGAAITGVRFLWLGGNNFSAQGAVRIYGIVNT